MSNLYYHDLRSFLEAAKKVDEFRVIEGADWNCEIGTLSEVTAEQLRLGLTLFGAFIGAGIAAGWAMLALPL